MLSTQEFLTTVVTGDEGYFVLAIGDNETNWKELWFKWPSDLQEIVDTADKLKEETNVYFSTYLFDARSTAKEHVLPTRTLQADLDDADVNNLPITPTILVQTSAGRHQGYWLLKEEVDLEVHEIISRKLTYAIPGCDHSGWPLGRKVRIANTFNYKYPEGRQAVTIIAAAQTRQYDASALELLPDAPSPVHENIDNEFLAHPQPIDIGPLNLLETIKDKIPLEVYNGYDSVASDRSIALWKLMCAAFRAGLTREQTYWLARSSANNKFSGLRYNGDRELAKDVLRAESLVSSGIIDSRDIVAQARKIPGSNHDKRQHIYEIVAELMDMQGRFLCTPEDNNYFIRADVGRPILMSERAEYLLLLLDMEFGLNPTEPETKYVAAALCNKARSSPNMAQTAALSYYDKENNVMFLHTGRKDVIRITKNGISTVSDGAFDLLFPWANSFQPFKLDFAALDKPWEELLFGDTASNVIEMPKAEALALLRVWLLFLFFRSEAVARPILAFFGQPGCTSENTQLQIKRGDHSPRTYNIATLYRMFQGGMNNTRTWDLTIPTKIMSLKDGIIIWREIKQVIFSGEKMTYTVIFNSQGSIRTTLDHRFLTHDGYKVLSELKAGDVVITKSKPLGGRGVRKNKRKSVPAKYHPYARYNKSTNAYTIYNYRAVVEAVNNNLSLESFLKIINTKKEKASTLIFLPKDVVIHHKDENHTNDNYENLSVTNKLEHDTVHRYKNQRSLGKYSGLFTTGYDTIISIEPYGVEPTYDISMQDEEAPNFIINDVVVHNSGKSTAFRKLYAFLYGKNRSLGAVTTAEDFDYAVASEPLVVLDNVDTWERWLPDRLALAASTSDIIKRKLYTDFDTVTLKRQAILAVTAHNPKFGREDVTDRLLILNLKRLEHFVAEGQIVSQITKLRPQIYGAIVHDIQRVLAQEEPAHHDLPQIRVEDFARLGYKIACALDIADEFRGAIGHIRQEQKSFILTEEVTLVESIRKLIKSDEKKNNTDFRSAGQLWILLESLSSDEKLFKEQYRNAPNLGKKLWALYDSLKSIMEIEFQWNPSLGARVWRFKNGTPQEANIN